MIDVGGTDGRVITQRIEDGTWKVDLLATLGGAFVPLVFDRVVDLGDGAAAGLIRARLVDTVLPSLDAAVAAYPGDPRLETEVIRIRRALGEP